MKKKRLMIGLLAAHALFEISVLFSGYIFGIDENNIYHRENFYWIYVSVFVITILYCYVSIIVGNKRFQSSLGFVDVLILIFLSFGIGVQMVYSYITVDFMCVSIGNFFFVSLLRKCNKSNRCHNETSESKMF
mgnify:CR=1 FL=1